MNSDELSNKTKVILAFSGVIAIIWIDGYIFHNLPMNETLWWHIPFLITTITVGLMLLMYGIIKMSE
jgi:hypothetical protein